MAPGIPVLKGHVKGHVRVKAEEARKVPPGIQKIDQESTSGKKKQRRDTLLGLRKIGAPRVGPLMESTRSHHNKFPSNRSTVDIAICTLIEPWDCWASTLKACSAQ